MSVDGVKRGSASEALRERDANGSVDRDPLGRDARLLLAFVLDINRENALRPVDASLGDLDMGDFDGEEYDGDLAGADDTDKSGGSEGGGIQGGMLGGGRRSASQSIWSC